MAILFKVNNAPPESPWSNFTNDSYWEPGDSDPESPWPDNEVWNGSAWESYEWGGGGWYHVNLTAIGIWADGYRPTQMRVTWTGNADLNFISLQDTTGSTIAFVGTPNPTSPAILDITFGSNDIGYFSTDTNFGQSQYFITGIEFL